MKDQITIRALSGIPLVEDGEDLSALISTALTTTGIVPETGDVLVVAQKIVSKAEGRTIDLRSVTPGKKSLELAKKCDKDPRLVELILSESKSIVRQVSGVLITEHKIGWIMANAGIDASNVSSDTGAENVLLLPENPDHSCTILKEKLDAIFNVNLGVVINDSFGRPWRYGTTGAAIGAAGIPSLWDRRGDRDLFGRELKVSQQAVADELANAASLLQGQGAEGIPVVLVRGVKFDDQIPDRPAADLIRDPSEDLFR